MILNGKGTISIHPRRRLRAMILLQAAWLALVLLMGVWWTRVALRQADHIQTLEVQAGLSLEQATRHWQQVNRMIFWESGTYFALLIAATLVLIWIYWREVMRTRSLQAFFASLTHELKTPLTSIRLQAESIQEETGPSRLVERLLEDTLRLESQVERTLELARVEGGGAYYPQRLRLRPFLEHLIQPWSESHQGRIRIINEISDVEVLADKAALAVVFRNLLENTVKHGRKEFLEVTLRTAVVDPHQIALIYQDNGTGLSTGADKLGQLYAKGPESSGAGVGLYLVKTLMNRMQGVALFSKDSSAESCGFKVSLLFRCPQEEAHG